MPQSARTIKPEHNKPSVKLPSVSLIITVRNEASTIEHLLQALLDQTQLPDEIIIVDGGSEDQTPVLINQFRQKHQVQLPQFKLLIEPQANISQGRNIAIQAAQGALIAITDAGCWPEPHWLQALLTTYQETGAALIGGPTRAQTKNGFEQAVAAYTLTMPDQIKPNHFHPTTRSWLMKKELWHQLDGFRPDLAVSEDYEFVYRAKNLHYQVAFSPQAQVDWLPRQNLAQFTLMIFKFALYDIKAGIIRSRVALLFARYWLGLSALIWLYPHWLSMALLTLIISLIYSFWAIRKNQTYTPDGWYWLPIFQFCADWCVMLGSLVGGLIFIIMHLQHTIRLLLQD